MLTGLISHVLCEHSLWTTGAVQPFGVHRAHVRELIDSTAGLILNLTNKQDVRAHSVNRTHRYFPHEAVVSEHRKTECQRRTYAEWQRGNIDAGQTMLSSKIVDGAQERRGRGTHRDTGRSFYEFDGRARRTKRKKELTRSEATDEIHRKDVHPTAILNAHDVDWPSHHVICVEASKIARRHSQSISASCRPNRVSPRQQVARPAANCRRGNIAGGDCSIEVQAAPPHRQRTGGVQDDTGERPTILDWIVEIEHRCCRVVCASLRRVDPDAQHEGPQRDWNVIT
jgi:hypothetical protein